MREALLKLTSSWVLDRSLVSRDGGRAFQAEATAWPKALSVQGASNKPLVMAEALGISSDGKRAG